MGAAPPPDRTRDDPTRAELLRAARQIVVRGRREVSGAFAGGYRSAFRGGGMEFEESRPYAPGDDVRALDWNAMARTGIPYVKHFREERDQTLILALDVSASMAFGSTGRSKALHAAHAAALLAVAAGRARDRIALVTWAARPRDVVRPGRGDAHTWRVVRTALEAAAQPSGPADLGAALDAAASQAGRRATLCVLSDFRGAETGARLAPLARRHELVAAVLVDPLETSLPDAGTLRVTAPAGGPSRLLRTRSARVRQRYAAACAARHAGLERSLRARGADVLWLPTQRAPLPALTRFFRERSGRVRVAP